MVMYEQLLVVTEFGKKFLALAFPLKREFHRVGWNNVRLERNTFDERVCSGICVMRVFFFFLIFHLEAEKM